jgi:hypothetical protein
MTARIRTNAPFLIALVATAMSMAACDPCEQYTCDLQSIERQTAAEGSVVTLNGETMTLLGGYVGEGDPAPAPGTCYATFGQSGPSTQEALPNDPGYDLAVTLSCTSSDGSSQVSFGAKVGDLSEPQTASMPLQAQGWHDHDAEGAVDGFFTFDATLDVEESAGTKADAPQMVTDDFKRVVRFNLSGGQAAASDQPNLSATLQFTLSAGHFQYDADTECEVCPM